MKKFPDLFEEIPYYETSSNFCFPFVCKNKKIFNTIVETFIKNKIEYRPIVSGNLLKQPFLKGYSLSINKSKTNVDKIHELGVYIGNNHFITKYDIKFLFKVIETI